MSDQLGMFPDPPRKRKGIAYQSTSRAAWESFQAVSGELDQKILGVLARRGADGATCNEIEQEIGRTHQAVSGNLTHLGERGLAVKTDMRGVTASGRPAIKWVLAGHDKGESP